MIAFLLYFFAFFIISLKAVFTSCEFFNPTFTPPASDLWMICGDTIFITTGYPIFFAACIASLSFLARILLGIGKPYARKTSCPSSSRRFFRPSSFTFSNTFSTFFLLTANLCIFPSSVFDHSVNLSIAFRDFIAVSAYL